MKKIVFVVALLLSDHGLAEGRYELEARINNACEDIGQNAVEAYQAKAKHKPMPKLDADVAPIVVEAMSYGYNEAKSAKDAYMVGWAKCQDRFAPKY